MILTAASTTPIRIQHYRTLAYVVVTLVYLVIGAAVFDKLESTEESLSHANLTVRIALFKQQHNISDKEFTNLTRTVELRLQYRKKQWKFVGSFYYSTVVLALIGYGHAIPYTLAGRAVTIAYALIGIPMWLIMIQSVGERLNALIRFVLKHIKRKFRKRREPQVTSMELLTCEALLTGLTLATGSYVFYRYENWRYFDAFYYCLLTL
jgi:potassium channel subfamily K protein 9